MDRTTRTLGHVKKGRDTFTMERPNVSSMNEGEERTTMLNGVLITYRKQQNQLWLNAWVKQGSATNFQILDATLTALANLTIGANELIYGTGVDAFSMLSVNATATNKFLRQVSSGVPSWEALTRADLTQENTVSYPILITDFRYNNGAIPTTTGNGSDGPEIVISSPSAGYGFFEGPLDAQSSLRYTRLICDYALRECYVSAGAVTVTISAGWIDGGSNTVGTKTVDCYVYKVDGNGVAGSDICATSVQTLTGATRTGYDFSVTATDLVAGNRLRIYIIVALQGSGGGVLYAQIGGATIKLSIKG